MKEIRAKKHLEELKVAHAMPTEQALELRATVCNLHAINMLEHNQRIQVIPCRQVAKSAIVT